MIGINLRICADEKDFDIEKFKKRLQEFMEFNLAGNYDFSICLNDKDDQKKLLEEAIWAVNLFDQANTGGVVERLGNRGKILKGAIDDLRNIINKGGKLTILSSEQVPKIKE